MSKSPDDVLKHYQATLGSEFGTVFHGLWREWVWSLLRRNEFRTLFTRVEDVSLLNAVTGGAFTWDIQQIFWEDLLLRVCRLTDPAKTGRKRNLSVNQLPAFCAQHDLELGDKVQELVVAAEEKAKFARDWRNRRISHSDYDRVVHNAEPLALASLEKVTMALDAIHSVLNAISIKLLDSEIANLLTSPPRAAAFLAYVRQLADSVKFVEEAVFEDRDKRAADSDISVDFLERLGLPQTATNYKRVRELLEATKRFD